MKGIGIVAVIIFTLLLVVGFMMLAGMMSLLRWMGRGADFSVEMAVVSVKEELFYSLADKLNLEELAFSSPSTIYRDFADLTMVTAERDWWERIMISGTRNPIIEDLKIFPRVFRYPASTEVLLIDHDGNCQGPEFSGLSIPKFLVSMDCGRYIPKCEICGSCKYGDFCISEVNGYQEGMLIVNRNEAYLLKFEVLE